MKKNVHKNHIFWNILEYFGTFYYFQNLKPQMKSQCIFSATRQSLSSKNADLDSTSEINKNFVLFFLPLSFLILFRTTVSKKIFGLIQKLYNIKLLNVFVRIKGLQYANIQRFCLTGLLNHLFEKNYFGVNIVFQCRSRPGSLPKH